ncbi:MAG: flagellar hook-basal body complex protein FliE [Candidatus Methylomirabilales bacterium]
MSPIVGIGRIEGVAAPSPVARPGAASGPGFGDALRQALDQVNRLQGEADRASQDYSLGRTRDIAGTLITIEKANLAVQLTLQIRNKLVEAYQEVMRMPM